MTATAVYAADRQLNELLGGEHEERRKFRRDTSHMMRKYFNTQLINAGMPEEIREHFMGHVISNKVRDAYFLAEPDELMKVYLKYMDCLTIKQGEIDCDDVPECAYKMLKA
ncbi:MAG: hypothetical protein ACXVHV_11245, partial [Methanobacterium sp.]